MQSLWYTNEQALNPTNYTLLNRHDADWEGLALNVKEYLNDFIAPHQLVSVSLFEESHPNNSGAIGAVIAHTAGVTPVRLSQTSASRSLPTAGIYKLDTIRAEETSMLTKQACTIMNNRGGQEGYMVATTNCCRVGDLFGMVLSWQAIYEDMLEEDLRPATCAGCNIF